MSSDDHSYGPEFSLNHGTGDTLRWPLCRCRAELCRWSYRKFKRRQRMYRKQRRGWP